MLVFHPASKQLAFDGLYQAGTYEVKLDGEVRSIHFDRLAIRFIVHVFVSATEGGGVASCEEEVQILGRRRGELDESGETASGTEGSCER